MSYEINTVYLKINELFKLNIEKQLTGSGYSFESFYEVIDLVTNTKYYTIAIQDTNLNFQDQAELRS